MGALTLATVLAVVAAPTSPTPTDGAPKDRVVALSITTPNHEVARDVEAFLCQRAHETFGVTCNALHDPSAWVFEATLTWLTPGRVSVLVQDQAGVLVSRVVEVEDPGAAKLTLWLLVRATMNRALAEPGRVTAGLVTPATPGPGSASSTPVLGPDPAVLKSEAVVSETANRSALGFGAYAAALINNPRLFAMGASLAVYGHVWRGLVLGGDLGYRLAPGVVTAAGEVGMMIHHLPFGVSLGWDFGESTSVCAGLFGSADVKIPVAAHRSAVALGVDTGAFVEARLPFARPDAQFLLRGSVALRPVRQRYLFDDGEVTEEPWALGLGTGVTWQ